MCVEISPVGARQTLDVKGLGIVLYPAAPLPSAKTVDRCKTALFKHIKYAENIETSENVIHIAFIEALIAGMGVQTAYHCYTAHRFCRFAVLFHEIFLSGAPADIDRVRFYLSKFIGKRFICHLTVPDERFVARVFQHSPDIFQFKRFIVDDAGEIVLCAGYFGMYQKYLLVFHHAHSSALSAR